MPKGGMRANAGRPAGTPNRATAERQRQIQESGLAPLDYLLQVMRDEHADRLTRLDAAKAAAPYVHPRLAAIQHLGPMSLPTHEDRLLELEQRARGPNLEVPRYDYQEAK